MENLTSTYLSHTTKGCVPLSSDVTENGLTDESLKTFTDLFVAANGDLLNEYGIVK